MSWSHGVLMAGSEMRFADLGPQQPKGVPNAWILFAVDGSG